MKIHNREYVDLPEWGGGVYVKAISANDDLMISARGEGGPEAFLESFLTKVAVDDDGRPIFTAEDMPALMNKSMGAVIRLVNAALRVNDMGL